LDYSHYVCNIVALQMKLFRRINLDFLGFSASFLCAVHCMAIPVIITSAAFSGFYWLSDPVIEITVILSSLIFATVSFTKGVVKQHGLFLPAGIAILGFVLLLAGHIWQPFYEAIFTGMAGITIAGAHLVNYRLVQKMVSITTRV
jgi:hypothetical protein